MHNNAFYCALKTRKMSLLGNMHPLNLIELSVALFCARHTRAHYFQNKGKNE